MEDRIRRVERDVEKVQANVERLESKVSDISTDHAVLVTTAKASERRLSGIEGSMNKLVWLVVAAFVATAMNWVLNGGLQIIGGSGG